MQDYEYEERDSRYKAEEDGNDKQKTHRMRLSIDIHSIKEANFRGLIYAKYGSIPSLGIKQFSTFPGLPIAPNSEENFKNSFSSYEFDCSKNELYSLIANTKLQIEIWHQDRFKNDIKVGVASLEMQKILNSSIKQTPQSYVRVHDAYIPVDDANDNSSTPKRLALIRTILYLEDLGPVEYLKQNEKAYKEKVDNYLNQIPIVPAELNLKHINEDQLNDNEKITLLSELNSIEYKIIWELETWKKSEEAKFKYQLKTKEIEYLSKLDEEWRKKEIEKEKLFKVRENQVQQLEHKLKQKSGELQKREQKLIVLEEELKQRISETSKQLAIKDEEITAIKKKQKEERAQFDKEKAALTAKLDETSTKLRRVEEDFLNFKKEQESSPINMIKEEVNKKNYEIINLKKEIEKLNEVKEQYRIHFEKLKEEIIKLKKANEALKDDLHKQQHSEIEQLKIKIGTLAMLEEKENLKNLKNDLETFKSQLQPQESTSMTTTNPFKKNYIEGTSKPRVQQQPKLARPKAVQDGSNFSLDEPKDELSRLIKQRDELLSLGIYDENDPLVLELTHQINNFK